MNLKLLTPIVTAILALVAAVASAQEVGSSVVKRGAIPDDFYSAGGTVDVSAEASGDVVVAGGQVTIGRLVKGDVIAAGGVVTISGQVLDDVRAAGGVVTLNGNIGGDVILAGGTISLSPETRIGGRAWLMGKNVDVRGSVGKGVRLTAGAVRISADLQGDVQVVAQDIQILPGARIRGNLTYWSPRVARIDPGAQIAGAITHHRPELPERAIKAGIAALVILKVVLFLGLLVAGIVLFLLFPGLTVASARTIQTDPWKSLGLGFVLLVVTPVAGVLLMVSLAGIPVALALLALYGVSLLAAYLTAVFFLGEAGARLFRRAPETSKGARLIWFVVALIVLSLFRLIPVLGGILLFLALVFGLGAWGMQLCRRYAGAER